MSGTRSRSRSRAGDPTGSAQPTTPPTVIGAGTYVLSVTAAPTVVGLPGGWAAGDLALWWANCSDTGGVGGPVAAPAGFTAIAQQHAGASASSLCIAHRILQSGDTTFDGPDMGNRQGAQILVFRGVNTSTPIDNIVSNAFSLTSNLDAASLLTNTNNALVLNLFDCHATSLPTLTNANGHTDAGTVNHGGSQVLILRWTYKTQVTAGLATMPDWTYAGGNWRSHTAIALMGT